MVQLKQLRTERGLTQKQIAKMLKTTHQTVARWESGKAEIPTEVVTKLAVILRCTIDTLLSKEPLEKSAHTSSNSFIDCLFELEKKALFGGVRFSFDGFDRQFNFPINGANSTEVDLSIRSVGDTDGADWLIIETMDNWRLFINLQLLSHIETYSIDAEDPPAYEHSDVYAALTNHMELKKENLPEAIWGYCVEKNRKFEQSHDCSLWDYYNQAIIYTRRGKEVNIFLDEDTSLEFADLEADYRRYYDGTHFLKFISENSKGFQAINVEQVALAMVPSIAYQNYIADEDSEFVNLDSIANPDSISSLEDTASNDS